MEYLVYAVYPILFIMILWGCGIYGKNQWNEECFSVRQMKAIQGFLAVCIILHHVGQKTCANWLPRHQIIPGLELFVPIGYLLVGVFLFCSGYGLYKSYQAKEDYLKGFFKRRMLPILLSAYVMNLVFFIARITRGEKMTPGKAICYLTGIRLCNTYSWFIYAILLFYLAFYIAFRFCRKERTAFLFVTLCVVGYTYIGTCINHNDWLFCGEWWYNCVYAFLLGLYFAGFEQPVSEHIKKHYWLYLVLAVVLFMPLYNMGEMAQGVLSYYGEAFRANHVVLRRWGCLLAQTLICFDFVSIVFLLGMKVRVGNKLLGFLGTITLEIYLVHPIFVELFCRSFLGFLRPVAFYKNVALYILIVTVPTIPLAILLKKAVEKCVRR